MKLLKYLLLLILAIPMISCLGDDESGYEEWRKENDEFMLAKENEKDANGKPVYEKVYATWNPQGYVLMKWHNDRSATNKNLSPMSNSTVDLKYHGRLITDEPFDSSYLRTTPRDSVYRSRLNTNVNGFIIGVSQMHIGDSCTIIIPYGQGYGAVSTGTVIPYSNLIFDVKLVDIPGYEIPVED